MKDGQFKLDLTERQVEALTAAAVVGMSFLTDSRAVGLAKAQLPQLTRAVRNALAMMGGYEKGAGVMLDTPDNVRANTAEGMQLATHLAQTLMEWLVTQSIRRSAEAGELPEIPAPAPATDGEAAA